MDNTSFLIDFIIVFLGILFALFFDKMNQKRSHKKRINNIMDIVKKDFINDLESAEKVTKNIEKNILFQKVINGDILNEKEKEQSMFLSCSYPLFQISTRGFNLLKDAKVDFDFKDSDLITEIINLYDRYLDIINSYSLFLRDNTTRNFRSFKKYPWAVEFYKSEISDGYLKLQESTEYKANLSYHYTLINRSWKGVVSSFQKEIKDTLPKIEKSSFN